MRINNKIIAKEVRLIDQDGEALGVVPLSRALERAEEQGLDLIEVSPNAIPPVCKILDYGKYKYELQKKKNEARKKQKIIDIKEIKFKPAIGDHDYHVKLRHIVKFIEADKTVKVSLRLRGRQLAHKDIAFQLLDKVKQDTIEIAKVDSHPKLEGKQIIMILSPLKK